MNQAKRPPNIPHQGPEHLTGEFLIAKLEMNADCTL